MAGIGIRTYRLGKEPIYIKEEKRDGDYYFINEKYAPTVKEWLAKK